MSHAMIATWENVKHNFDSDGFIASLSFRSRFVEELFSFHRYLNNTIEIP